MLSAIANFFTAIGAFFSAISAWLAETVNVIFGPILHPIFDPINAFLIDLYMPWARIVAIGFFVGTMIWAFMLRKEYLQIDAPNKSIFTDLRVWTVISMLPHVIIYFLL